MISLARRKWAEIRTLPVVAVVLLAGCGGGGKLGDSANKVEVSMGRQEGRVVLPVGSPYRLDSLVVSGSFGTSAIQEDGRYSLPVNVVSAQLVSVQASGGQRVLSTIANVERLGQDISARTTAISLIVQAPGISSPVPGSASEAVRLVERLQETSDLEATVSDAIRRGVPLEEDLTVRNRLAAAVEAARSALLDGRARGVDPNETQSGIAVETMDDRDPSSLKFRVVNFGQRFVTVYPQVVDSQGNPIGGPGRSFWVSTADTISVGSLLTGRALQPAATNFTGQCEHGHRIRLNVWGPGARGFSQVNKQEFVSKAGAASLCTMVVNFLGPALDASLGVDLFTGSTSDPRYLARLVEDMERLQAAVNVQQLAIALAERDSGALLAFTLDLLTDESFITFVVGYSAYLGLDVVLSGTAIRAAIRQVLWVTRLLGLTGLALSAHTLVTSRPLERFHVFPGTTNNPNPFRATLSWDKPNDVDLHVWSPNGEHSYYGNMDIADGELDFDDVDGFGPENFTCRRLRPGIYRVAVNYYTDSQQAPTEATVVIQTASGRRTFGPHVLTLPNRNSGYPVGANTESWWRVCDVEVQSNGRVTVRPPDTSIALSRGRSLTSEHGKE